MTIISEMSLCGEAAHEYSGQLERHLSSKGTSYEKTSMNFSRDYVCSRKPRVRAALMPG
jgi:hypothetical protein